jgi:hypothetical protein
LRGEDVLGFTVEDIGGDGVNTITLSSLFFNCLAFSALSDMSAIIPIVTNAEKINAIIDGITIITNFPEFILVKKNYGISRANKLFLWLLPNQDISN